MRRRSVALTALIALIILGAGISAHAQGVRFITPQDGDTVRDVVKVQATKPSPDEGWISYKIERGGSGDFVSAVTSPYIYLWDTRRRDEAGSEQYPDGQYTLTAVALNPAGRKIAEEAITVTLSNAISASDAPQQVELSLVYPRNTEVRYRAEGQWTISPAASEDEPEDVYELAKTFNGALVANWRNKVMSPTYAAGHALLHVNVGSSGAQAGESDVEALDRAGDSLTYRALRNGEMRRRHDDEPEFKLAEMTVPLPGRPVKVGDTWQGRITIWPDPLKGTGASAAGGMEGIEGMDPGMMGMDPGMMGMGGEMGMGVAAAPPSAAPTEVETRTVRATHTLAGFEWVQGYAAARIRSTYSVDDDKITIPSPAAGGMIGGEGEAMFGGAPGEMGMAGSFGDSPDAMGMGGAGQGAEKETSYAGERITYWALELNRPVLIIDTVTHTLEIDRPAAMQMGMAEGMEGMPFEPGMMPPGMDPGAMPPGMDPEAMPGGYDPFGGYGGMQPMAPPAKPMKVNVRVALRIQEVGL